MTDVRVVSAAETRALRQRVLRPHQTIEDLERSDDDAPHFAAYDDSGRLVACASVRPEPFPGEERASGWRLRGMASEPEVRGQGYGAAVLAAVIAHARNDDAAEVWCTARVTARDFYARHGFVAAGDVWEDPAYVGPHLYMRLAL
ncbi:MAG TPA: GNAT family N-acetyltransferase [Mycobacteriales bacterium]|nr:GNAT family N-acetyltransferase [Mycobacteriales bacterium]